MLPLSIQRLHDRLEAYLQVRLTGNRHLLMQRTAWVHLLLGNRNAQAFQREQRADMERQRAAERARTDALMTDLVERYLRTELQRLRAAEAERLAEWGRLRAERREQRAQLDFFMRREVRSCSCVPFYWVCKAGHMHSLTPLAPRFSLAVPRRRRRRSASGASARPSWRLLRTARRWQTTRRPW